VNEPSPKVNPTIPKEENMNEPAQRFNFLPAGRFLHSGGQAATSGGGAMKRIAVLCRCAALSGATTDPPQVTSDNCTLNLKKTRQYIFDKGNVVSTQDGLQLTRQRLENISLRHVEVLVPFMSSGTQLWCAFDTQTERATDAHLSSGLILNHTDIQQVRADGLCQ